MYSSDSLTALLMGEHNSHQQSDTLLQELLGIKFTCFYFCTVTMYSHTLVPADAS